MSRLVTAHRGHMKINHNQQSQTSPADLLGITEAAISYGIPEGTLRYWLHLRLIASYKLGRRRKLRRSDLEAFIESNREEAAR